MGNTLTIEDFYKEKLNWVPDNFQKGIGHFNVFKLDEYVGDNAKKFPYSRKDFYKISLIVGKYDVHYADKTVRTNGNCLFFSNPQIPYNWEEVDGRQSGFCCVFTESFISLIQNFKDYPVYNPKGDPIFDLNADQTAEVSAIYLKMFDELDSEYAYKYDALRNLMLQLIHFAQKLKPAETIHTNSNANERISSLFMQLLERQFPIETPYQQIKFRSAGEYADQLAVHVNHLNRALKATTGKTTTELISDRIIREAVALLKHTNWNVSEIAHTLGFEEPTHFNNFFKKITKQTPTKYRIV